MKVVITGGTGLIGSALAESLIRDGHEVVILTRNPQRGGVSLPGVTLAKWDGKSAGGWAHFIEGADAVVNLAGENLSSGLWTEERKQRILSSRVNAGRAVVEAVKAADHKPAVVIQASGVGYYGVENLELLAENAPLGGDFLSNVSRGWEASTQSVEAMGVRRVIIRTSVVLSRKGGAMGLMLLPFRLFVGGPLGSGQQWMSWIHLEDEVRAIRYLIENKEAKGAFNLAAEPVTNTVFSKTAGKVLHRPSFIKVPAFVLKLVLGEMATMVLEGQRASSKKLTDLGFKFKYDRIEEALKNLT